MMQAAHDSLGHRGAYAAKNMLGERFWWPDIERDVTWYVKTCHRCQERSKRIVEIPPTVTHTPSIFQVLHADTVHMTPASNGCKKNANPTVWFFYFFFISGCHKR